VFVQHSSDTVRYLLVVMIFYCANTTAFQMPDWKFSEGVVWLNWVAAKWVAACSQLNKIGQWSKTNLGPFCIMQCVNTGITFLTRHWCGNFFASSTQRATVQHFVVVIEGISGETQRAVWKVNLKFQPEFSGKI